jgi:hypothetical protein
VTGIPVTNEDLLVPKVLRTAVTGIPVTTAPRSYAKSTQNSELCHFCLPSFFSFQVYSHALKALSHEALARTPGENFVG